MIFGRQIVVHSLVAPLFVSFCMSVEFSSLINRAAIWCGSSRVPSAGSYPYYLMTYFLPSIVSTWSSTQLTTYYLGMELSPFVAFFGFSTEFHCCRILCSVDIVLVFSNRLSATCVCIWDCVRPYMESLFGILSSSILAYVNERWVICAGQMFVARICCNYDSAFHQQYLAQ